MKPAVTRSYGTTRKGASGKPSAPAGKGFPHVGMRRTKAPIDRKFGEVIPRGSSFLMMQVVLVELIIDATGRDAEQAGRLRLVPMSLVHSGFE